MIRPPSTRLWWRLGLLVTALGLVGMHHLVAAHQHVPTDVPAASAHAQDGHGVHDVPASGPAALLHHHPDGGGHDPAALLHLCLAVLVGGVALVVALVLIALVRPAPRRRGGAGAVVTVVPRPPPTSSRLATLRLLRL